MRTLSMADRLCLGSSMRRNRENAMELCAIVGVHPGQIGALFHGTTVATNIVIEHDGAEVDMMVSAVPTPPSC